MYGTLRANNIRSLMTPFDIPQVEGYLVEGTSQVIEAVLREKCREDPLGTRIANKLYTHTSNFSTLIRPPPFRASILSARMGGSCSSSKCDGASKGGSQRGPRRWSVAGTASVATRRWIIRRIATGWRVAAWSAATVMMATAWGCGGGPADGLDRKAVYGKVTLDGAPLAKGLISFDPAPGSTGTAPAGAVIVDGAYSIDASAGPTPGKYKVSIRSAGEDQEIDPNAPPGATPKPKSKAKPVDPIPKKYNIDSTLTADIQASGATEADFTLESK